MTFTLRIPVPPSVNGAYVNKRGGGGRFKSNRYTAWIESANKHYMTQKRATKPVRGPYEAKIRLPQDMRGDVDNRTKLLLDYLVRLELTDDDKHCAKLTVERDPGLAGECVVTIRPYVPLVMAG